MSEESNENANRFSPVDLLFATTVGVGLVCLLAKYRGGALQRLRKTVSVLTDPLCHMNPVIVNTPKECQDIVQKLKLKCGEYSALGFDCEWVTVNGYRHPVALVQLAANDGLCALIRVCKMRYIPPDLQALLEDESILKVGVAPSDDARYLLKDYGVLVRGCLDLRHLTVGTGARPKGGLAGLSETLLGVKLDKSWHVRCSDWEAPQLSERQVDYAARDAMVGIELFKVLGGRRWKMEDLELYLDVKFKHKNAVSSHRRDDKSKNKNVGVSSPELANTSLKPQRINKPLSRAFVTRRTTMYYNCFMQAPDGELLCTCDRKKALWYVSKGLATQICEEPLTIKLNFEPAGRVVDEAGLFYTQVKGNHCVVCGNTESYLRKNIVPHEYRKHFPRVMKDHTSHDVLLICVNCHIQSNLHDSMLRGKLAELCDAPIGTLSDIKVYDNQEARQARLAAKALLLSSHKIPEQRKKELEETVLSFHKDQLEVTPDLLQKTVKVDCSVVNSGYQPHGLKVVQFFSSQTQGGLVELERLWRQHFLETMRPRFMPNLWSVTHNRARLSQRAEENRVLAQDLNVAGLSDYTHLLQNESPESSEPSSSENTMDTCIRRNTGAKQDTVDKPSLQCQT